MSLSYQCCLCKKPVTAAGDGGHSLDPCAIVLVGHADRDWREQKEQTFYCHAECFRRMVNDDGLMYILDRDYSTNGEVEDEEQSQPT